MGAFNVIAWIGVLVFAVGGGGGVWWFDHHANLDFIAPVPVRWVLPAGWKHVHLVGAAVERDAALADAASARAQLAALTQQSATKVAQAQEIAREAQASAKRAQAKGRAVLAVKRPAGADSCAFAKQVDSEFLKGLGE